MESRTGSNYFVNCFLLTLPVLVWDIVFANKLPVAFQPETFRNGIPPALTYGENILRTLVFIFTLLMPLRISTPVQKKGLILYTGGTFLYFSSWLVLIYFPDSAWSRSMPGFLAPAYTPLFWLAGIGLIGDSFYFGLPYRRWFIMLVLLIFLVLHNLHAYIIYIRAH